MAGRSSTAVTIAECKRQCNVQTGAASACTIYNTGLEDNIRRLRGGKDQQGSGAIDLVIWEGINHFKEIEDHEPPKHKLWYASLSILVAGAFTVSFHNSHQACQSIFAVP